MITLFEKAYAKLNLTLDVLGKRPDGYHDLQSVMQTVSLHDDISIDIGTGASWSLSCTDETIPCDEKNLAWKAATVYFDAIGTDPRGLHIHIEKRIPSQAGMGGGSSDAAAVLKALNRHYEAMSTEALISLSSRVGSDVPFCVMGGTAMVEGRGERVRRLADMPRCHIVICKPAFSLSTPELFRRLDETEVLVHPDNPAMEQALTAGDLTAMSKQVFNVFDPVVSASHPELDMIKAKCRMYEALCQQMTGSGSAVFAIMPDHAAAAELFDALRCDMEDVFVAEPV